MSNVQTSVLFAGSVAVAVTVVVPTGNALPLAGLYVMMEEQLSVALALNVTVAVQAPAPVFTAMFEGQVMIGSSLSVTVTVNVHTSVFPAGSVAVAVTVVVPTGNALPLAWL